MSAILMSDEQAGDFASRLKTLDWVVRLGIALLVGAFGIGVWVSTIQIAVNKNTEAQDSDQSRLRSLELNEATEAEKLRNILTVVDRIDRKLNKTSE